jgi:hypothetical protein
MLGGNDGWLLNENLLDQIPIWRRGEYLKVPLSIKKVKSEFNLKTFSIGGSAHVADETK